MLKKLNRYSFAVLSIIFAILLLAMSKQIGDGIRSGLTICTNVIIPSLFPFMVFSNFVCLSSVGGIIAKPLNPITKNLFKLPCEMGTVLLMSFIGGYPVGAKIIASLVEQKKLSPDTASRMLCFCVNAGPSFIIGAIGVGIFGSFEMGVVLLISQICSAVLIGIIISRKCKVEPIKNNNQALSVPSAFTISVVNSATAMFQICSFIVIFSGIVSLLQNSGAMLYVSIFLSRFSPYPFMDTSFYSAVIAGFFEVTAGSLYAVNLSGDIAFFLIAFMISFSGLSIIFQVAACVKDLNIDMKPFVFSRLAHGCITATIAFPLYKKFVKTISASAITSPPIMVITPNSILLTLCMLSMCSIMLLSISVNGISCRK